mgnify:CR=1 FL=1
MNSQNFLPIESRLENAKSSFHNWRTTRTKKTRIPEALWKEAVALYPEYTLGKISSALRLSHTDLKKRIKLSEQDPASDAERVPAFIEVGFPTEPATVSECVVEMEDGNGAKMRMCFKGKTDFDLLELGRAFWRKNL